MDTVLNADIRKITEARHHDPFSVLGKHDEQDRVAVRAFIHEATEVMVVEGGHSLQPIDGTGLFEWRGSRGSIPDRYRLIWRDNEHRGRGGRGPGGGPPGGAGGGGRRGGGGGRGRAGGGRGARPREGGD